MSRLNTQPRTFNTKTTYRTVIRPDVNPSHPMFPGFRVYDFVAVPRLTTQGEWPISYMLSDEQLVHLAVLANHLKPAKPRSQHAEYAERFERKRQARVTASKAAKGGNRGA